MIVIDTSIIVAIISAAPGRAELAARMFAHADRGISAVSVVEATMVLSRELLDPKSAVESYLDRGKISILNVDQNHVRWAQYAFLNFGKGRHPARLNFGDCFTYAAAKVFDAPLLFIGKDFSQTDLRAA